MGCATCFLDEGRPGRVDSVGGYATEQCSNELVGLYRQQGFCKIMGGGRVFPKMGHLGHPTW